MIKELTKKRCLSDNERYADLINGAVFGGRQMLRPQDLSDVDSQAILRRGRFADGSARGASRRRRDDRSRYHDMIKKAAFGVNFAVISLEDQDKVHYLMPLRSMVYDAVEYDRQAEAIRRQVRKLPNITEEEFLSGFLKSSRLLPCITFVLYFGEEWDGSRDLHGILDMRDIPEELQAYVNHYPIHLIEVRKLENTDVFRTDLKQIFDFIRCSKEREKLRELVQNDPAYREMDEAAYDLVAEYAHAEGLIAMKKYHGKDGKVDMCKAMEDWAAEEQKKGLEKGIEQGIEQGLEQGLEQGILCVIEAYRECNVSEEEIMLRLCSKFDLTPERAKEYMGLCRK